MEYGKKLPERTIERLSKYRRMLTNSISEMKTNIYSHELASLMHITPEQVRRDIMLIGYSGSQSKGYDVADLVELINKIIDNSEGQKIVMVGMGNLGRAIVSYFIGKRTKMTIVAAFDVDPDKINRVVSGIRCYHVDKLTEIIRAEKVTMGVIAVPTDEATKIATQLIFSGIKGILNYTSVPLRVPEHVYLEEYDILTSLEKVSYFSK